MSSALLVPAIAASLFANGGEPAVGSETVSSPAVEVAVDGYLTSASAPALFIENEPFVVTVTIRATGEKPVEVPSWLLAPSGWLVDNRPLERRAKTGDFILQPEQTLTTKVDLSASITARLGENPRDFRIQFAETDEDPTEVIWLSLPERGLDFETLPKKQLDRYQVVLQTSGGPIWIELWPDVAPNHVRNFLDLCATGFYDGSEFHRVIPGFMIQGGQAKDGRAAPRKLEAEFSSRRHDAGVLSAARLGSDINSATSEFFVVHKPSPHLDGNYSAFGKVVWGMESVDNVVRAVDVHYKLVDAFTKSGVRINPRAQNVATAMNTPNPMQVIEQALIVRATKSRPKAR